MESFARPHLRARSIFQAPRLLVSGGTALAVSLVNQGLSSGTNFMLAVALVRWLDAPEFGAYGIAIAGILLFSGTGNALLLTQMVVHLPARGVVERPDYLARYLLLVVAFVGAFLALILAAALIVRHGFHQSDPANLLVVSGIAAAGYLIKDYFSRVCYSLRREASALAINVGITAAVAVTLLVFGESGIDGPVPALAVYSAGQWCGVFTGVFVCRQSIRLSKGGSVASIVREAMPGGRWALGGVILTWLQSQAYVYTTAMFAGAAGVGYANSARIFVAPLLMAAPALNQVTVPRLASLRELGDAAVANAGRRLTVLVSLGVLVYVAALAMLYPTAVGIILPDTYVGVGALVSAWCVVVLAQLLRDGASTLMQVFRKFRNLTLAAALVACLAIPMTALLTRSFGAGGAVWATAMAELGLALILWQRIRRHVQ